MITITSRLAVIRPPSSTFSVRPIKSDSSEVKANFTVEGQVFCCSATSLRTAATVSRMLAPLRLVTPMEKAGWPL